MKLVILLFVWSFFTLGINAQPLPEQFSLQQFDSSNGLSNSAINSIFQDKDKLIWISTWDGLNLYDGSVFHVFNYNKDTDYKSIGNNVIQQVIEDKNNNNWISTIGGISKYNKTSGKFSNYFYEQDEKSKISEQEYQLTVDTAGSVFCLIQKQGLAYYNATKDLFQICYQQTENWTNKILFDEQNDLWVLTKEGNLILYSHNKTLFKPSYTIKKEQKIHDFFYLNKHIVFQTIDGKVYEVKSLKERSTGLKVPLIKAMTFYGDHYILAWASQGYGVYSKNFQTSIFLQSQAQEMQHMRITSWEEGSENILWAGTDGNGILKITPNTTPFGTISTSNEKFSYNKPVRSFSNENQNLWIGTKGAGIIRIINFKYANLNNVDKQYFSAPKYLDNNSVYGLKKGAEDLIYIGTDGIGIGLYDIVNKKFFKWKDIQGHDRYPEFGSVYAIQQDPDQSVWLGTSGYGLIHLKLHRTPAGTIAIDFLITYAYTNANSGPANDIIYALENGDADHLWIACRYGGLNLFNKKTEEFKTFKAFSYEGSLSHNDILSLYRDNKDRIWVGTSYGLNWIRQKDALKQRPTFQKLTTANGLPNNTIHAIEGDAEGNIWVSTNKGLARINPERLEISHYKESDGLKSNEFNDGAVWKDKNGYLFFGNIYGVNFFQPNAIQNNTVNTNLLISAIVLGGENENEHNFTVLTPNETANRSFTLPRNKGFFELDCKVINFLNAEKCEYEYFLEGYDSDWNYGGTNGRITYQNLPPGDYKLLLRWSNGEGNWTRDATAFQIKVKQYFWLTTPVLFFYFLIIATFGYGLYKYRKDKLRIKNQLVMEQFFTNITHELQTPLTLIMGTTQLSIIQKHAARLTYLVEQLLEFRKADAGFLKNQYSLINISHALNSLTNLFMPLSLQHDINYIITIQPDIIAYVDRDKLEKIMFNLLSNAFKYSDDGETIQFVLTKNTNKNELQIIVSNSGCELSDEQKKKLFDRYYTGMINGVFGTGFGLAFTKELVHLLKGKINVSNEQKIVTFEVFIPLTIPKNKIDKDLSRNTRSMTKDAPQLYHSMVSLHSSTPVSVVENNKQAILESLEGDKRQKILLVEDEAEIRDLLKNILKAHYIIYEATNGNEALEIIKKVIPDMIISDIMMPDMDGLELCSIIKNTPSTCHIAFIILSAKGSIEHRTEGYESGADAYIAKPFHTNHLLVRIRKLFDYKQNLNSLFASNTSVDLAKATIMEGDKNFLERLIHVIHENMDASDLNAVILEDALGVSKMQLYRKLKTITNMTPGEFVKHIRLKQAAYLLESTQLTVSEIFYQTGFNNQSYFFREFKKRYQCTPNEYRISHQYGTIVH